MNERQHIQATSNPTTWSQWGKAVFAFTVATSAYAMSKAVGMTWRSLTDPTQQLDSKENNMQSLLNEIGNSYAMKHQHVEECVLSISPFIAISTLALTTPRNPLISLSAFGLSVFNQVQSTEAAFPATMDLATLNANQGVIFQGAARGDTIGASVSGAGDINGDGVDDIIIGATAASPLNRNTAGVAYLIFGQSGRWPGTIDLNSLTNTQGVVLQGAMVDERTGRSVCGVGDINGDGIDDVAVGAYQAAPLSRSAAGMVYLIFGRNGSWPASLDLANFNSSQGVVLQGAASGDNTGISVSGAGDINGDGLSDVLLGAHQASPSSNRADAGVAYIIFGKNGIWPATIDLDSLTNTQGVILEGATGADYTGRSLSGVGDVNGDGIDDVIIGAALADPLSRNQAGVAYLIFGQNGAWPTEINLASLTLTQGVVLQGASTGDGTGHSVCGAGDINNDGINDVVIGAWLADPLSRGAAGKVYLLFGRNNSWTATIDLASLSPSQGIVLSGATAGDRTGVSVCHAGDANGDGIDEVLVGAYFADPLGRSSAGKAYLLKGRNGSWPATIDLANITSDIGTTLQGAASSDYTGGAIKRAGDVNGDGLVDILIGANAADPLNRPGAGVVYLIFGQRDQISSSTTNELTYRSTPTSRSDESTLSAQPTLSQNNLSRFNQDSTTNRDSSLIFASNQRQSSMSYTTILSSLIAAMPTINQNSINFSIMSNSSLVVEIGIEEMITIENLSVIGFNGDPSQLIFTVSNTTGVTFFVNDESTNQFTLFDLQSGYVDLLVDTAGCEEDLSSLEVEASDGRNSISSTLNLDVRYESCPSNKASNLNANSSVRGMGMLLVGSGLGLLTSNRREKTKANRSDVEQSRNRNDNHDEIKLSK